MHKRVWILLFSLDGKLYLVDKIVKNLFTRIINLEEPLVSKSHSAYKSHTIRFNLASQICTSNNGSRKLKSCCEYALKIVTANEFRFFYGWSSNSFGEYYSIFKTVTLAELEQERFYMGFLKVLLSFDSSRPRHEIWNEKYMTTLLSQKKLIWSQIIIHQLFGWKRLTYQRSKQIWDVLYLHLGRCL